ncbi:MAG TPA: alcohol dehydrogenase [Acidimicrobiales bacterium]|nr:alcohol dehydrogenase [Acidimicrobiales bacterium]
MKAVVMRAGKLVLDEVPDPIPGPGEVLLRTLACGICGSDLHALRHLDRMVEAQNAGGVLSGGLSSDLDLIMGHEFAGEVVESGDGESGGVDIGKRVCSMPIMFRGGRLHSVGYDNEIPGGFAEYMVLNSATLIEVPNGLDTETAALTEPMSVGRHAVAKAALTEDDVALVVGCGPVGLSVIAALRQKGVHPIVAADFSPARRELAVAFGADIVVDPGAGSPYERWQDMAWPPGVDRDDPLVRVLGPKPRPGVVFECVGVPGVLQEILDGAMRDTRVVVVGVCMEHDRIRPLTGIGKEINIQFVLGYTPEEFAATLSDLAEGELRPQPMISGRVGLEGVPAAFEALADPESHAKIVVDPTLVG